MTSLRIPVSTYRFQFHRRFRFDHAVALVPYLEALGVTDLYASPIFQARRGSSHGYDVTDPTRLNVELGGEGNFESLAKALQDRGMGILLDIVPNHMAASVENRWW
ncbi:MAG: malto-oligosyltrehalose synthase, partial [Deltaproteobacteria bacterium]|nr:malto-oligosyltrehalose synthase [Deltaproteobacteria bacterium]